MATFERAYQANELIYDAPRYNNTARRIIQQIDAVYQRLIDLDATEEEAIRQAVRDIGYDDTEIAALLAAWRRVKQAMDAEPAIIALKEPR